MLKKVLLSILFLNLTEQNMYPSNNDQLDPFKTMIAGGVISCAVTWMISYGLNAESNSSIIDRAKVCITQHASLLDNVRAFLSSKTVRDVPHTIVNAQKKYYFTPEQHENELLAYKQQLLTIHDELVFRYDNLLTPWNWSSDMKNAVTDIKDTVKNIDQLLYQSTLQRIKALLVTAFVDDITLLAQEYAKQQSAIYTIEQTYVKKDEIKEFLNLAAILTKELSQRSSNVLDCDTYEVKKNRHDLQVLIEQAKFLDIMCSDAYFLLPAMTSKEVLTKRVQTLDWGTNYIFVDIVNHIDNHINKLQSMNISSEKYVQNGIQLLRQVYCILINSEQYRTELRAYDSYLEQKRQREAAEKAAAAAERQAKSAQEAADAAKRQARAAEERNRIERERNELERKKQQQNNNNRW